MKEDLKQIYDTIKKVKNELDRAKLTAIACRNLGHNFEKQAEHFDEYAAFLTDMLANGFAQFKLGKTKLNIDLPDELENLAENAVSLLSKSLLPKYQKEVKKEDIERHYQSFIKEMRAEANPITLTKMNSLFHYGYFRIDCGSATIEKKEYWMLQLQDNTGKDSKGKPHKLRGGKSASSVFAIIKIPKNIKAVSGQQLAGGIQQCIYNRETCTLTTAADKNKAGTIIVGDTEGHTVDHYGQVDGAGAMTPKTVDMHNKLHDPSCDAKAFCSLIKSDFSGSRKAKINAQNPDGNTALMTAILDTGLFNDKLKLNKAKLLLRENASLEIANNDGHTGADLLPDNLQFLKQ